MATKENNPYPFRMTLEMRTELEKKAKDSGRSLQKEMIQRLDLSLEIERWFSKEVKSLDGVLPYVIHMMKDAATSNDKLESMSAEIKRLMGINKKLMESVRVDEKQRLVDVRREALSIQSSINNILEKIPSELVSNKNLSDKISRNESDSKVDLGKLLDDLDDQI